ncbi:HPr-rel-A system PqqD family peptide chaperone [Telluria aromaticivorans]|uniref:HPr-rel-A system PqqD family peptide chaperone n=1 Tax=Telluria aromaticivorans TaxID=2725995 RepID=A0A7Y2P1S9_9BURK|nr:HPr-rel-A system PqqD family peptide chaperone [Telluria aromaticivorans]NNG24194.1 HPr-rel-A system PqqD family peptide chaperone [Telluria aromaticivorans]
MWRVIPGQLLVHRCWDDEAVLYNDLSGATHLLGPAALCVLEALRGGPAPDTALSAALLDEFEIDPSLLHEELAGLLDSLARLDLIERCAC